MTSFTACLMAVRKNGSEFQANCAFEQIEHSRGKALLVRIRPAYQSRLRQPIQPDEDTPYRILIENMPDYAIYHLDLAGRVATWNIGARRLKGYSPEEVIGESFSRFFTLEENKRAIPMKLLHLAAERGKIMREGWRVRKDGTQFWADVVLAAIYEGDELLGFAEIVRDTTDHKSAENTLMLGLTQALLASAGSSKLLAVVSSTLRLIVPCDCAAVQVVEPETNKFRMMFLETDELDAGRSDIMVPADVSFAKRAIETGEPVILAHFADVPHSEALKFLIEIGMLSGCWVPLSFQDQPFGALVVASRQTDAFQQCHAKILLEVAKHAAFAVLNVIASRRLAGSNEEFRDPQQPAGGSVPAGTGSNSSDHLLKQTLEGTVRERILQVLRDAKGKIGGNDGAAKRLDLNRSTLYSKMKKLHIERHDYI